LTRSSPLADGAGYFVQSQGSWASILVDGVIRDARENIGKIGLRIDAVHPAGLDDGVDAGGALSTRIGAIGS